MTAIKEITDLDGNKIEICDICDRAMVAHTTQFQDSTEYWALQHLKGNRCQKCDSNVCVECLDIKISMNHLVYDRKLEICKKCNIPCTQCGEAITQFEKINYECWGDKLPFLFKLDLAEEYLEDDITIYSCETKGSCLRCHIQSVIDKKHQKYLEEEREREKILKKREQEEKELKKKEREEEERKIYEKWKKREG